MRITVYKITALKLCCNRKVKRRSFSSDGQRSEDEKNRVRRSRKPEMREREPKVKQ